MREGSVPLALSHGAMIRGSLLLLFLPTNSPPGDARGFRPSRALPWDWDSRLLLLSFLLTNSQPGEREGSVPLALSHGDCDSRLLLLSFLRTNSPPGEREGSVPLALSHGDCDSRLLLLLFLRTDSPPGDARGFRPSRALPWGLRFAAPYFFYFFPRTRRRGCERVPTLSRSPVGLGFAAPASFVSSHELAAGGARGFRPSRSLPWGRDSRLLLLLFLRTDSPPGDARGFRPSRVLPWGCDSRLSTSFASPFVSPYSSGMRTVSDWGGTVTAVDSFLGCAESRFAERKSVWVMASGSVTRISRSAERLYTR